MKLITLFQSPGISLNKLKYKKILTKFKNKNNYRFRFTFLSNKNFKSIVVTGTNGKSTTCKIISHLLHKNKFNVQLGGNIGTPVLNLKIKKKYFFHHICFIFSTFILKVYTSKLRGFIKYYK